MANSLRYNWEDIIIEQMVGWGSEEVCNIFENRNSLAIAGNSIQFLRQAALPTELPSCCVLN